MGDMFFKSNSISSKYEEFEEFSEDSEEIEEE
jgi:hypothetical protein